jgi:predicted RNase H-like nuclease
MAVVGADGCKTGWFAVRLEEGGEWHIRVFPGIKALWTAWHDASLILIDVPIGLPDTHILKRQCDTVARRYLGRVHSRVFTPPCWASLPAATYEQASRINYEVTGRRLTQQAWGILPKIREVNNFLLEDRDARSKVREVHPEICFWAFAGGRPIGTPKKSSDGWEERCNLLARIDNRADMVLKSALQSPNEGFSKDDVADALVAAVTALHRPDELASIPDERQWDAHGLLMEMVHRRLPLQ